MKTKRKLLLMTAIAALFLAAFFAGCKKDKFTETVGLCPAVVSTSPLNGATGVPLNQIITVTFNKQMNPATITPASFTLQGPTAISALKTKPEPGVQASSALQGLTAIEGTISYADTVASFTPSSPLTINTTYSGRISTTVKDLLGNPLLVDYVFTFSTGATLAPMVTSTNPISNATGVFLNKIITATFSVPMDTLTINDSTFTITKGGIKVAGKISYNGTIVSFKPTSALTPLSIYTVTITNGVKNIAGTAMVNNYIWSFTTGSVTAPTVTLTDPANLASGVALAKKITVTFSEPMDSLTLTATTFTLKQAGITVPGTYTHTATTVTFTPTGNLLSGTLYTATITDGAMNLAGTPLANDHIWTFTTISIPAPTVTLTDPASGALNVVLNKKITVTFNEPIDSFSLTATTFLVKLGATTIPGTYTHTATTVTFTPTSGLLSDNTYTATITTGAENLAGIPLANDYVWSFSTLAHLGPAFVDLKSVERFGIISGVGVSNNAGFSVINNMDVGIYPGVRTSVTGFPPAVVTGMNTLSGMNAAIYASDDIAPPGTAAMLMQAKLDLVAAYLFAEAATTPAPATVAGDQGGTTLAPGIYKSTSTLLIQSGDLTLDAQGDENAVWIFQIASDFTTVGGAGGNVILTGKAQAKNIFWQVGSSATIGDNTSFYGNVLALTSITMNSNAVAVGRMLCQNGAIVLTSTNIIIKP